MLDMLKVNMYNCNSCRVEAIIWTLDFVLSVTSLRDAGLNEVFGFLIQCDPGLFLTSKSLD